MTYVAHAVLPYSYPERIKLNYLCICSYVIQSWKQAPDRKQSVCLKKKNTRIWALEH